MDFNLLYHRWSCAHVPTSTPNGIHVHSSTPGTPRCAWAHGCGTARYTWVLHRCVHLDAQVCTPKHTCVTQEQTQANLSWRNGQASIMSLSPKKHQVTPSDFRSIISQEVVGINLLGQHLFGKLLSQGI